MYEFIHLFAPHLTRTMVEKAERLHDNEAVKALFEQIQLEMR